MIRSLGIVLILLAAPAESTRASHFAIELTASAGKQSQTAQGETAGTGLKPGTRPILHVKAGTKVQVNWTMTNKHTKDTFKDVLVHFFVVGEKEAGQQVIPDLRKGALVESALTMDFAAGERSQGELSFTIETPGAYLLRLETIGAAVGPDGHEHFAALDVVCP